MFQLGGCQSTCLGLIVLRRNLFHNFLAQRSLERKRQRWTSVLKMYRKNHKHLKELRRQIDVALMCRKRQSKQRSMRSVCRHADPGDDSVALLQACGSW